MTYKPSEYLGYIAKSKTDDGYIMTNWMGIEYGKVTFLTDTPNPSIMVTAINEITYIGTYYKNSGDCCKVTQYIANN